MDKLEMSIEIHNILEKQSRSTARKMRRVIELYVIDLLERLGEVDNFCDAICESGYIATIVVSKSSRVVKLHGEKWLVSEDTLLPTFIGATTTEALRNASKWAIRHKLVG